MSTSASDKTAIVSLCAGGIMTTDPVYPVRQSMLTRSAWKRTGKSGPAYNVTRTFTCDIPGLMPITATVEHINEQVKAIHVAHSDGSTICTQGSPKGVKKKTKKKVGKKALKKTSSSFDRFDFDE